MSVIDGKKNNKYSINPFAFEMHEQRVAYKKEEKERKKEYEEKYKTKEDDGEEDDLKKDKVELELEWDDQDKDVSPKNKTIVGKISKKNSAHSSSKKKASLNLIEQEDSETEFALV